MDAAKNFQRVQRCRSGRQLTGTEQAGVPAGERFLTPRGREHSQACVRAQAGVRVGARGVHQSEILPVVLGPVIVGDAAVGMVLGQMHGVVETDQQDHIYFTLCDRMPLAQYRCPVCISTRTAWAGKRSRATRTTRAEPVRVTTKSPSTTSESGVLPALSVYTGWLGVAVSLQPLSVSMVTQSSLRKGVPCA